MHSFCYKLREDLTGDEAVAVRRAPGFSVPHAEDVFCITKRWMHSDIAAPPVLVLPKERLDLLHTPGPTDLKAKTHPMTAARQRELRDLARHLEGMTESWGTNFSYYRASAALRNLAALHVPRPVPHTWLWEQDPVRQGTIEATQNRYFNTMPEMAWNLMLRFRRLQCG